MALAEPGHRRLIDRELRAHLDLTAEEQQQTGLPPDQARHAARRAFGNTTLVKENVCKTWVWTSLERFVRDVHYTVRLLRRNPSFTIVAVSCLGLGIGAATVVFSVTNAVLLRPLPYHDSDRLVLVWMDFAKNMSDAPFSNAYFNDLRDGTKDMFEEMNSIMVFRAIVAREDGNAERISKAHVTTSFFPMMGARVAFGRDFTAADGHARVTQKEYIFPPQGDVAILSHDYWQRRYGGDTAVIGRELRSFGQQGPQIIGVLAPGFTLVLPVRATTEPEPDVWIANNLGYDEAHRGLLSHRVIGRLRRGTRLEQAQDRVDRVVADWRARFPRNAEAEFSIRLEPWHESLVAEFRRDILVLMSAVVLLLLITCANVANLLLVRMSSRARELAMRASLGASRGRLVRQALTESVLLSGLGTLLGLAVTWAGIRTLPGLLPAEIPRIDSTDIDLVVLAFAALTGLLSAAVFGVIPALRVSRPDVMQLLGRGGKTAGLGAGRFLRSSVVVTQVALSFVLLIGSGLMVRSFHTLSLIDPGFDPGGLFTCLLLGDGQGIEPGRRRALLREMQKRLSAIPGVERASAALSLPLAHRRGSGKDGIRWAKGSSLTNLELTNLVDVQIVLPDYFETLRTPLIEGQTFSEDDNAPGRNVAVIDQIFAARAFPNESALGKTVTIQWFPEALSLEVIGVVAHQRQRSLAQPGREQIYLTDGMAGMGISRHWAIRATGDSADIGMAIRHAASDVAPGGFAVTEMQPMGALVDRAKAATRFVLILVGLFTVFAVLLATVGIYGALSAVVRQRTAEIGVRMAMGARPSEIFRHVVGQGIGLSVVGIFLGLIAALGFTRGMTTLLVGVEPNDPATFTAVAALFLFIATVASWLPARKAAHISPAETLRRE